MADDKKTIGPDVGTSAEATEQPRPAPDLADTAAPASLGAAALTMEEQLILEHEGQAALFEMGEATLGQLVPRRWRKAKGQRSLRALAFPVSPADNGNTDCRLFYCHERSALWPKQLAEKNIHTKSEKSHSLSRLSTKTRASLCVTFF